jgi:hypothetical protein
MLRLVVAFPGRLLVSGRPRWLVTTSEARLTIPALAGILARGLILAHGPSSGGAALFVRTRLRGCRITVRVAARGLGTLIWLARLARGLGSFRMSLCHETLLEHAVSGDFPIGMAGQASAADPGSCQWMGVDRR